MTAKRKLIEVALPLEAINRESAREKSIRHGHPSTLHLWWARRPLAAARAVLFAQLVDDPSAHPEEFPTEEAQTVERQRLFDLLERLVVWENTTDEGLLAEAHAEILKSTDGNPPPILDPFAGGGSIPLEAQRLGLEAHASDLNPVAVLINKALIEIPPKWAGQPPVYPGAAASKLGAWPRATGLAEDVRRYGQWMRDQAAARIGHLYPKTTLPDGTKATVIAWIWARTVTCPNPACGIQIPLVRSFWLSKKKDRPTWLQPVVAEGETRYEVHTGSGSGPDPDGTVGRGGATCIACDTPVQLKYIREQGRTVGLGSQMMATVAEGPRQRIYVQTDTAQMTAAASAQPEDVPETDLPAKALGFRVQAYGMDQHRKLFTGRQLVALTTFSDLVGEARERVGQDALQAGLAVDQASGYADAVALYLAFAVSRSADRSSTICSWDSSPKMEALRNTFARQAIPMTWDYAEGNPFSHSSGNFQDNVAFITKTIERVPAGPRIGSARQLDAQSVNDPGAAVSTDPPYYDNIGYADLSDFFYVWLRRSLGSIYPTETATMLTPKAEELVATPYRFGGSKQKAEEHFESGFVRTFTRLRAQQPADVPITIFYAFKQAEKDDAGTASTGWETMLNGLITAGWSVTATWPMRTELSNRILSSGTNALASSIVLACRPRPESAEAVSRRGFITALRAELPPALKTLAQGSIAPVDLAQAAIGPGMAVFSRYARVVETDGSDMGVRTALALINEVLDEVLSDQEGEFDADTRFCLTWFDQYGWNDAEFGRADDLARSRNTSVDGLVQGGIFWARGGRAQLVAPEEMSEGWNAQTDERISVWEVAMRLARALSKDGVDAAAALMSAAGNRVDLDAVKELSYLMFSLSERRNRTDTALLFNQLGSSWADVVAASRRTATPGDAGQSVIEF